MSTVYQYQTITFVNTHAGSSNPNKKHKVSAMWNLAIVGTFQVVTKCCYELQITKFVLVHYTLQSVYMKKSQTWVNCDPTTLVGCTADCLHSSNFVKYVNSDTSSMISTGIMNPVKHKLWLHYWLVASKSSRHKFVDYRDCIVPASQL